MERLPNNGGAKLGWVTAAQLDEPVAAEFVSGFHLIAILPSSRRVAIAIFIVNRAVDRERAAIAVAVQGAGYAPPFPALLCGADPEVPARIRVPVSVDVRIDVSIVVGVDVRICVGVYVGVAVRRLGEGDAALALDAGLSVRAAHVLALSLERTRSQSVRRLDDAVLIARTVVVSSAGLPAPAVEAHELLDTAPVVAGRAEG